MIRSFAREVVTFRSWQLAQRLLDDVFASRSLIAIPFVTPARNRGVITNPNEIDRSVGCRLRDKRVSRGWSQGQLAEKMQMDAKDLSAYEQGAKGISAQLITCCALPRSCACRLSTSSDLKKNSRLSVRLLPARPSLNKDCGSIEPLPASRTPRCARRSSPLWSNWRKTTSPSSTAHSEPRQNTARKTPPPRGGGKRAPRC